MRRTLSETLVDLAEAMLPQRDIAEWFRVTGISMSFPIEVALRRVDDGMDLLADAPRWRWRTPFDEEPGRMHITWEENPNP